jgi:hypothetical protein
MQGPVQLDAFAADAAPLGLPVRAKCQGEVRQQGAALRTTATKVLRGKKSTPDAGSRPTRAIVGRSCAPAGLCPSNRRSGKRLVPIRMAE